MLHIMLSSLMLLGGLGLLIAGGELLIRGATMLSARLRVAPVVVGMTVVAFGTSTPELVVNLTAALRGDSAIGFGNVVGSNIANIGLLLAITAIAYPMVIHRSIVSREIPMMVLASAAIVVLGLNSLTEGTSDRFTRGDGLMLLLLFGVFLYYTLADAIHQHDSDELFPNLAKTNGSQPRGASVLRTLVFIGVGLGLLIIGGILTVRGGIGLARVVGIPEVVVGLTLIAVGTSLPELATSLIAVRRGHPDMAVGNIVGSNIFNLLFIWGLSIIIAPTDLPAGGRVDLLVMTVFAAVLLPMALTRRRISRLEGSLLLLGYIGYMMWLALR